ncbi:MAG: CsgG/HfaB family protein [Elusimicrobiota bacterium]
MNRCIMFVLSMLLCVSPVLTVYATAEEATELSTKESVVVYPFNDSTGKSLSQAVTDLVINKIINLGRFTIVEREKLQKILAEQQLAMSGAVDENTAVKIGQLLGAKKAIAGTITVYDATKGEGDDGVKWSANIGMVVRLIDIETAELLKSSEVRGSGSGKTEGAAKQAALSSAMTSIEYDIRKMFKLKLKIANITDKGVYITAGNNLGLKKGYKFDVIRRGEPIKDSEGNILEIPKEKVATLKVEQVHGNTSIAKVSASKGEIKPGDMLEEWVTFGLRAYVGLNYLPFQMTASTVTMTWFDGVDTYDLGFTQKAMSSTLGVFFGAEKEADPFTAGMRAGFVFGGEKISAGEVGLYGKAELTGQVISVGANIDLGLLYAFGTLGTVGKGNVSGANFAWGPKGEKINEGTAINAAGYALGITPSADVRLNLSDTSGINLNVGYRLYSPIDTNSWSIMTKDSDDKEIELVTSGTKTLRGARPSTLNTGGLVINVSWVMMF